MKGRVGAVRAHRASVGSLIADKDEAFVFEEDIYPGVAVNLLAWHDDAAERKSRGRVAVEICRDNRAWPLGKTNLIHFSTNGAVDAEAIAS